MIEIKHLTFSYDNHVVLNDLSIQFENSIVHGVVGLNGAGKSTLFNLMAGVLKNEIAILYNRNKIARTDVAYLETNNFFYSRLTGNEYLKIFPASNNSFNLEIFNELLLLPLNELIETYSTGMKKKLALLAILKQDKPIYIFDEPFNGLDLETNKLVEIAIEKLRQKGKTIIISSHILEPLLNLCDTIHHLELGSIKHSYSKTDFNKIENELFQHFKIRAKDAIEGAL